MLFKDIPIQKKLMRVILLISSVMLLVTCTAFFFYELYTFRQSTMQKLSTLGEVIAANSTAALAFDNNEDANAILSALKAEPHIVAACLYDKKNKLFSKYPESLADSSFPVTIKQEGYHFDHSYLEGFQPVAEGTRQLGTLYLKSDLGDMYARLRLYGIVTLLVIVVSFLLSYLLSKILQKSISMPILALAETAKTISVNRDYSVRAVKSGDDELGSLTDSFNVMLQQIQDQNNSLKEFNQKLEQSEKLFRAMIEKDADMKTLATPDGKVIYASPSLTKILGYENHEFMTTPAFELIHPDDVPGLIEAVTDIVQTPGKSFYRQQRLKHKNGTWLWCEGTITNMLHEPAVAALVSNFRDITGRKKAEESIRLAEANYREIFDKASDAIYVHEIGTGKVLEVNQRACEITGYTKEELISSDPQDFITNHPQYTLQHAFNYLQKAADGKPQLFEWLGKNKDGSYTWLEVNLKKASIAGEERILAFFREINDRKKAQVEVQKLNEELEQKVMDRTAELQSANKELESFTYSVSHDLRSPLRIIDGYADILISDYKDKLDGEGNRTLNIVKTNARRMGQLIDDLLNFSQTGKKELVVQLTDMNKLVKAVIDEQLSLTGNIATVKMGKLEPAECDSRLLRQVWINLISNAIKYSGKQKKPEIQISSVRKEDKVVYSVKDNGVGFDMQYAEKLFGVFQRLHKITEFEGTGIGLALVNRILIRHKGKIWAESETGKGATFCFSLPAVQEGLPA